MQHIELTDLTKSYALDSGEAIQSIRAMIFGRPRTERAARVKVAVNNLSLRIDSGERVGIIGPNGAGKSTLLHMIAGTGVPTSGHVNVEGKVTSILTLGIGLRDEVSGRENIYLDGELQGKNRKEIESQLEAIVAFAELGDFIDRPVRTYSTGMKSRLAFAMISHIDPEILLIDEALSVGDAAFSAKASKRIRQICEKGKIVVVVSHGLAAINEICSRCIWMDNGRILMDGRPDEVTRAYAAAVHEGDGRELLERFNSLVGAEQFLEGFSINGLELRSADATTRVSVLQQGQGFIARIKAEATESPGRWSLRLVLERLDGLCLVDASTAYGAPVKSLDVAFPPALAYGVYKLMAELSADGIPAAKRSMVFEVVSEDRPVGGRPALRYPCAISVTPLTQHG